MIRCRQCGLRLRQAEPHCPVHGPPPPAIGSTRPPALESDDDIEVIGRAFSTLGYRVTEILGRGGFGVVYGAERIRDALPVAIKVALRGQREGSEQLAREAAALELVGPPHVPMLYERGTVLDRYFLTLEYVAAPTLAERLVRDAGPMPLSDFAELAAAILEALGAIHAHGFVHRDLKPENIFILEQGARIIDFGLAIRDAAAGELSPSTEATMADDAGTDEYMSPEQCHGFTDLDRRSDIYSLGALFYEMLTGAPPFFGNAAEVREAHRSLRPVPLSRRIKCTAALEQTLRRCLAKERSQRFDSVQALQAALEGALSSVSPASTPSIRPPAIMPASKPLQAAATAARLKQTMGLLFFEAAEDVGALQSIVSSSGGQLVQSNGSQYVAAFGHDSGDNPGRIALAAARHLRTLKVASTVCVDVGAVSVQVRVDGSRRVFSALFAKKERFPSAADPAGILLTAAAAEVLPDVPFAPIPGRADRVLVERVTQSEEATLLGVHALALVGRDGVLRELLESARCAFSAEAPALATVIGEPGCGRSHLANVLAQRIEQALTVDVIKLTVQESMVGAVSQVLPDLLRRLLDLPASAPQDGGRALLIERLGQETANQIWCAAAFSLGWIDADHPDVVRLAAAPGALRLAAARAAGEALRRKSSEKPVALILDDAHLADDPTLDALEYATLKQTPARVWICALVRPTFELGRPGFGTRAAASLKLKLEPLTPSDAGELARRLLHPAEYVPTSVLAHLAERTQGMPRLMVELVRGLKRDGLVRRNERGTGHYLATDELEKLPDLPIIQWNTSREIEALPPQLAGHARLASVLGGNFSLPELDALLVVLESSDLPGDMQLDASVGIQRLVDAGILVRQRGGLFNFRHALLRDTIYLLIPDTLRKSLHRAAFEMYQQLQMAHEARLPRLALHAAKCGENQIAAATYLELAERAANTHAYLEAERAFGSALDNLDETDPRGVAAARGRGLMRFRLGRHEDAVKDLESAREKAQTHGALKCAAEIMIDQSTVLDWTRDLVRSAELVRAVEELPIERTPLLEARIAMGRTRVHHRRGETELAMRFGTEAVTRARELGDAGYEAYVIGLLMLAPDCANSGQLDQAERHFDALVAAAEAHSDFHHLAGAHINRGGTLWAARRNMERFYADLTRAVQIARDIGEPLLEYFALFNMGEGAYCVEDWEKAAEYTTRALQLARQLWGEVSREVGTRQLLLARIAVCRGDLPAACELVAQIRLRIVDGHDKGAAEVDFFPPDQVLFEMVELAATRADEATWNLFTERARAVELQPLEEVECAEQRALSAYRSGRKAESRRYMELALQLDARKPNLMTERVRRRFAELFGAEGPPP